MLPRKEKALYLLVLAFLASNLQQAHCFAPPRKAINIRPSQRVESKTTKSINPLNIPRGGETELNMAVAPLATLENVLFPVLQSGPYGIVAITAVTAAAVVPLTIYKQLYSISVGYGAAIFLAGLALQMAFSPSTVGQALTAALMFYGFRLASYLFVREQTRKTPNPGARPEGTFFKKVTLALSVSLFYACLTTPALYALRNLDSLAVSSNKLLVTQGGIGMAFVGAILEAVADLQKYIVKQYSDSGKNQFQGPTGLAYRICRHPNYLGEIVFWAGIFVAGVPSFGRNILPWVVSIPGLYGIVSIMKMSTARLEGQQQEKYSGQEKYDTWVKQVKAPLVPFL